MTDLDFDFLASGSKDAADYTHDRTSRLKGPITQPDERVVPVRRQRPPHAGRRHGQLHSNADGTADDQTVFVRADDQIALELEKSDTGNLSASDLKTRELLRPRSAAHHLAQQETNSGDLFWSLPDHFTASHKTRFRVARVARDSMLSKKPGRDLFRSSFSVKSSLVA